MTGSSTVPRLDGQTFAQVMACWPAGVAVVTTIDASGTPRGLTTTAVTSVSLDPPLLLVCVDRTSRTLPALRYARAFAVNVLEAWAEAQRLLEGLSAEQIAKAQAIQRASQSEGQRRMVALHGGRSDGLEVYPNLWAGVGLVRGGAGTALVGSHQEVSARIAEYHALGIEEFILSGYPHLEELYRVGEGVMPVLRGAGLLTGGQPMEAARATIQVPSARVAL